MMGICLHPKYGGWFALRSVLIFKTLKYPSLPRVTPEDLLNGDESLIIDVLQRFNYSWEDSTYRNVIPAIETYSPLQQSYFLTKPKDRLVWLENLRQNNNENV
jgi:methylmalonic aciduria homocystinuria type C protein